MAEESSLAYTTRHKLCFQLEEFDKSIVGALSILMTRRRQYYSWPASTCRTMRSVRRSAPIGS